VVLMPAPRPGSGFWTGVAWAMPPSLVLWAGIIRAVQAVLP
jgi:hypothetical protein